MLFGVLRRFSLIVRELANNFWGRKDEPADKLAGSFNSVLFLKFSEIVQLLGVVNIVRTPMWD